LNTNKLKFKTKTRTVFNSAEHYIQGLFQAEKRERNLERISERVTDAEYHKIQHFISESPWDAQAVMQSVPKDAHRLFKKFKKVGLIIDESAEEKKGNHSVGVAHQYCGNKGKLANCQVAVYGCLAAEQYASLIDARLYLPKEWTDDKKRCDKAGIPEEKQVFKKKTELALQIIKAQRQAGTDFDWVGGDAFYGNDYHLLKSLDECDELFVMDIHSNQHVYLKEPVLSVPDKQGKSGPAPIHLKANISSIAVNEYIETLTEKQWKKVEIRKGTKGKITAKGHVVKVHTWNKEDSTTCERLLLIRKTKKGKATEIKYALTNAFEDEFSLQELMYMQSQRYWIEFALKEAKQDIGMCEYQVRGWLAWHHHMALVMMAQYFVLSEKILYKQDLPMLSAADIRKMIIYEYAEMPYNEDLLWQQMHKRHQQRQRDIDRNYD
jgi:SRSO17 transposase